MIKENLRTMKRTVEYRGVKIKVLYRTEDGGQRLWSWKGVMPDGEPWLGCFSNYRSADDVVYWAKRNIDSYIEINCNCPVGLDCPTMSGAVDKFRCPNREVCGSA